MLNHIWLALIAIGLAAAVGNDVNDEVRNSYRNGVPVDVQWSSPQSAPSSGRWDGEIILSARQFNELYGIGWQTEEIRHPANRTVVPGGNDIIHLTMGDHSPAMWREMAKSAATKGRLSGTVTAHDAEAGTMTMVIEPIHFVKMKAVTQAALDFANVAVDLSLGLIGIMALWLGLIKIAEEAGLVLLLTRALAPLTKRIFPEVPPDHPAVGAMIMNIAANMLGLNNAATPMGLKAMEELNKLNPKAGTATNAMVTFLTINTGGLVLIPATAIAVRAASGSFNPGIIIGTSIFGAACATVAGVMASKLLQRLPRYKKELLVDVPKEKEDRHE